MQIVCKYDFYANILNYLTAEQEILKLFNSQFGRQCQKQGPIHRFGILEKISYLCSANKTGCSSAR